MKKAILISGDFEDNTMTFEVKGEMILVSGKYVILTEEEYKKLSSVPVFNSNTMNSIRKITAKIVKQTKPSENE